jgi:hypothetical protein
MVIGYDVGERTSCFLDLGEREVENVNKRGHRISNHVELWARNAFDD